MSTRGEPIRVAVVDDHPMYRTGLRTMVEDEPGLEFVGEAADGDAAVDLCDTEAPDVVLMDIKMPGTSGVEATRLVTSRNPSVGVLMLTMLEDDTSVFAAMRAGARGYILKGSDPEEIVRAIRAVASGEAIFGPRLAQRMREFFRYDGSRGSHPFPELTPREQEMLELIASGHGNAGIAAALGVSGKTVRNNVSNILTKLMVSDRPAAIVKAREAGLGKSGPGGA